MTLVFFFRQIKMEHWYKDPYMYTAIILVIVVILFIISYTFSTRMVDISALDKLKFWKKPKPMV